MASMLAAMGRDVRPPGAREIDLFLASESLGADWLERELDEAMGVRHARYRAGLPDRAC